MKKILACLAAFATASPLVIQASPFRTRFVCVPPIAPNDEPLEFRIRDQAQCAENELYMEVRSGGDGSILLLPADDPLTAAERQDLEKYRKYFGGRPENGGASGATP